MMKKICFLLAACLFFLSAIAQTEIPWLGKIQWINGYARTISGERISYFSALPDYANTALLTRATDGNKIIEWETAPVPEKLNGPYVYFGWVAAHSTGTNSGVRHFDLYVNDEKLLTFSTYPNNSRSDWTFSAADSSRLVFHQKRMDGNRDAHGYAYLRLPKSRIRPGQPVRIKVTGQQQQSNDWYMTFTFTFAEKADIAATPFLLKNGRQLLSLTSLHLGEAKRMQVVVNERKTYNLVALEGVNYCDIPVPAVQKEDSVHVRVSVDGKELVNRYVVIRPVVHRSLYFVHHSHTDIGYSHLQPEVEQIHNRNIDEAIRMIGLTRKLPADAQFKWNVESLWAVENYLKQATGTQKDQFLAAVKSGDIDLSAMYANILTGMSEPEEMFHYTDYATRLKKEYGLSFPVAMSSDVPGFAWSTVSALSKAGVKYFSIGSNFIGMQHPYLGDRAGHFLKVWGDNPVWWLSPGGEEKILLWAGGKGYSSWHGTAPGGVFDNGHRKIAAYLDELNNKDYPYDIVQWRYNIVADNGPVDTSISRFVAEWNKKYSSPRILLSTAEKMFRDLESKYGKQLPVVKGDISPYWEDGAMSTAAEEGTNRVNSLRLQQLTTLYSMLAPQRYDPQQFYEAWRNIILFHEHTWGAHNSISQPDIPFVTEQWRIKRQFMLDAAKGVDQLENELLGTYSDAQSKTIAVFNTSSWNRSGPVFLAGTVTAKTLKAADGNLYPIQQLGDGRSVFMARDLPPLGTALFELVDAPAQTVNPFSVTDSTVSNGKIDITWSRSDGSITKISNGDLFNFAGRLYQQGLNSYWYVPGLDPAAALSNGQVKVAVVESGPVVTTVSIRSAAPGAHQLERRLSLFAGDDMVWIENLVDKKAVRTKESVHFGFPFNDRLQSVLLDAGYGSIRFPEDQLKGSNKDYLYGRRWLDVSGKDKGIQFLWLQAPLTEPGAMIDERQTEQLAHKHWKLEAAPTSNWFSYVMNNYWHTNYKADQEGLSKFNYALRPHGPASSIDNEQAAEAFTQPLLAIPVKKGMLRNGSLFGLSDPRVVVTNISPEKNNSFLVRLFNPGSSPIETVFRWNRLQPGQVMDAGTGKILEAGKPVRVAGMGVLELKLTL